VGLVEGLSYLTVIGIAKLSSRARWCVRCSWRIVSPCGRCRHCSVVISND
jgi:hypothetical protein